MSGFLGGGIGPVALKRRRAAGITPDQIAGLQLWLKADAITGLADGDAIATWTDSSGNGRNATQSTAGAKPTYKAGIIGGKPVARFDGGDSLNTPEIRAGLGNLHAFAVHQRPNVLVGILWQRVFSSSDGGDDTTAPRWAMFTPWNVSGGPVTYSPRIGQKIGTNLAIQAVRVGWGYANYNFQGDIAEIIIYDSVLSDANRQAVEAYLSAKYGIALA